MFIVGFVYLLCSHRRWWTRGRFAANCVFFVRTTCLWVSMFINNLSKLSCLWTNKRVPLESNNGKIIKSGHCFNNGLFFFYQWVQRFFLFLALCGLFLSGELIVTTWPHVTFFVGLYCLCVAGELRCLVVVLLLNSKVTADLVTHQVLCFTKDSSTYSWWLQIPREAR